MYKYAIVSSRIIKYLPESLKHELGWDHETALVHFIDSFGCNRVTTADNFIEGTLDELNGIINERDRIHKERVKAALAKYPQATDTEKQIIRYMIDDGCDPNELTYDEVQRVTQEVISYCEFNSSLLDAYMDYMH